jgi:hypothetical protein
VSQTFNVTLISPRTGKPEQLSGSIPDDEWNLLTRFLAYSYRLAECRMAESQAQLKFGVKAEIGQPTTFEVVLPPEDDIAAFLHRMRPFVLEKEATYFPKVRNIVARYLTLPSVRQHLDLLKDRYAGKALGFTITFGSLSLTGGEAIDKWLNAFEYHQDEDKQTQLRAMYATFPEPAARALFLTAMLARASAVGKLGALIDAITKRDGVERPLRA